jgi:16S rRNA (guanine(527)-N(7))-methyltransferase RsmG
MATQREDFVAALRNYAPDFQIELSGEQSELLAEYYALVLKWNELHLVAPCAPQEFAVRHVLESLMLIRHLPAGAHVADVGSGGGLPMIPCLLVRADLHATLIESSRRKAVFLREALRLIDSPDRARIVAARFEAIAFPAADFVTCRALDRFAGLLPDLIQRTPAGCTLLLFAGDSLRSQIQSLLPATQTELIPGSEARFLVIGSKS